MDNLMTSAIHITIKLIATPDLQTQGPSMYLASITEAISVHTMSLISIITLWFFVCGSKYHVTSLAKLLCIYLWSTLIVSTTVLQSSGDFDLVHEFSEEGFNLESARHPILFLQPMIMYHTHALKSYISGLLFIAISDRIILKFHINPRLWYPVSY